MPITTVSPAGLVLIKTYEGLAKKRPDGNIESYPDPASGGAPWTIGYGSTGPDIKPHTIWTLAQCEDRLARDVENFARQVNVLLTRPPTQNQFNAMVSLAYNVGVANFKQSSVLTNHNAGHFSTAAMAFALWNKARVGGRLTPMPGLTKRRAAESAMYQA